MDWGKIAIASALLSVLTGCVMVSREQQLQDAREKVWAKYGGRQSGACTQPGAHRVTHPELPLRYAHGLEFRADPSFPHSEYAETPDAEARGSLKKSEIRAEINRHIGEVRRCYETGMNGWPELTGRVSVKFIIQPDGGVYWAAIASTTLHSDPVECCILDVASRWQFPDPEGEGIVVVTYPFVLEQISAR